MAHPVGLRRAGLSVDLGVDVCRQTGLADSCPRGDDHPNHRRWSLRFSPCYEVFGRLAAIAIVTEYATLPHEIHRLIPPGVARRRATLPDRDDISRAPRSRQREGRPAKGVDREHAPPEAPSRPLRAPADQRGVWQAFNVAVGNSDGHGKNLSLLYDGVGVRLAPFYDLRSTRHYQALDRSLAMAVAAPRRRHALQAALGGLRGGRGPGAKPRRDDCPKRTRPGDTGPAELGCARRTSRRRRDGSAAREADRSAGATQVLSRQGLVSESRPVWALAAPRPGEGPRREADGASGAVTPSASPKSSAAARAAG